MKCAQTLRMCGWRLHVCILWRLIISHWVSIYLLTHTTHHYAGGEIHLSKCSVAHSLLCEGDCDILKVSTLSMSYHRLSTSMFQVWLYAADLETSEARKKAVLRRSLEFVPNSVKLWYHYRIRFLFRTFEWLIPFLCTVMVFCVF